MRTAAAIHKHHNHCCCRHTEHVARQPNCHHHDKPISRRGRRHFLMPQVVVAVSSSPTSATTVMRHRLSPSIQDNEVALPSPPPSSILLSLSLPCQPPPCHRLISLTRASPAKSLCHQLCLAKMNPFPIFPLSFNHPIPPPPSSPCRSELSSSTRCCGSPCHSPHWPPTFSRHAMPRNTSPWPLVEREEEEVEGERDPPMRA